MNERVLYIKEGPSLAQLSDSFFNGSNIKMSVEENGHAYVIVANIKKMAMTDKLCLELDVGTLILTGTYDTHRRTGCVVSHQ